MERMIIKHSSGSKENQVEEFPLNHYAELILGRESTATVQYDPDRDDLVGRIHAKIKIDPNNQNGFLIEDAGSKNGKREAEAAQKVHRAADRAHDGGLVVLHQVKQLAFGGVFRRRLLKHSEQVHQGKGQQDERAHPEESSSVHRILTGYTGNRRSRPVARHRLQFETYADP